MKRTTKKERAANARQFYEIFKNDNVGRAVIVVKRNKSTSNPYTNRTQFLAVTSQIQGTPVVIAEDSHLGVEGCWVEFFHNILGKVRQITYYDDGFKDWVNENAMFNITYYDGLAFIIERLEDK